MPTVAPEVRPTSRTWPIVFVVVCAAWWIAKVLWSNPANQWDFRVYYFAAMAWRSGLNPYDPAALPPVHGDAVYPFVYPPYSLGAFALFTFLPLAAATRLFLLLKFAALAWLIRIWARLARAPLWDPTWVLFLIFAYSSCIFVDFASGNVTTFEQALLWSGVASLIAGRRWPFVWATVGVSLLKLSPIVLLLVLFALPGSRPWRYVLAGFGAFVGVLAVTYAISPRLMARFLQSATPFGERGLVNPSLLALVRDAALAVESRVPIGASMQTALYLGIAVAIIGLTWGAIARAARSAVPDRREAIIYLSLLAYALVLPRFKNYSYMLLILPTYYVATRSTRLARALPVLIIAGLPVYSWLTSAQNITLLANYSQYFIALGAWGLFLYELGEPVRAPEPSTVSV